MENRAQERYKRNIARVASETLNQLREAGELSQWLRYFWDILDDTFVVQKPTGDSYIGSYCVMVPDELIYALGFRPLRLCAGHSVAALVGDELIPRDACPVVKASMGFHAMQTLPIYEQCRLAVLPMTCDAKRKCASLLTEYLTVIPLRIPSAKSDENFEQMVEDMWGLVRSLSALTGAKLTNRALVRSVREINAAQKEAYKLYGFLKQGCISGSQVMAVMNSYCYDTPAAWTKRVEMLNLYLELNGQTQSDGPRKKPRIFIAGAPVTFPNFKLPLLLESAGAQIVGDETCMAGRLLYDPAVPADLSTSGIIRALTARYVAACTCPVFDQTEDRLYNIEERLRFTGAEGIIYHVLRGCTPYDYEFQAVEELTGHLGVPILRVETDFLSEDAEQVRIRLEAFCEIIEQRRNTI